MIVAVAGDNVPRLVDYAPDFISWDLASEAAQAIPKYRVPSLANAHIER